jgi:predicted dehydrogenase
MVREARARCASGAIGAIRKVFVEYHQGWLATKARGRGRAQAEWRTDPKQAGLGGALGDIGTHAEQLVRVHHRAAPRSSRCAPTSDQLRARARARRRRERPAPLRRGGAKGVLTASQICAGEGNGLSIRIYGDDRRAALASGTPRSSKLPPRRRPGTTIARGGPGTGDAVAQAASRIPVGHPEGFIEAFANIYAGAAEHVEGARTDVRCRRHGMIHPDARSDSGRTRGSVRRATGLESARAGWTWVRRTD